MVFDLLEPPPDEPPPERPPPPPPDLPDLPEPPVCTLVLPSFSTMRPFLPKLLFPYRLKKSTVYSIGSYAFP